MRRLADLTDKLEQLGVGGKATLTVIRGGSRTSLSVEIVDVDHSH